MAMFKAVATEQFKLLCVVFLLGHSYRLIPATPASACDSDLYLRVLVAHYFVFLTTVPAVMLLLYVRLLVNITEAETESLVHGADPVAKADARVKGIDRLKRAALRGALLLAVGLSATSSFLAVVTFMDGYRYRRGCADGSGSGSRSPIAVVLMVFMALLHGFFAWVAVCKD